MGKVPIGSHGGEAPYPPRACLSDDFVAFVTA